MMKQPDSPARMCSGISAARRGLKKSWRWLLGLGGLALAWHALQGVAWPKVWHLLTGLGSLSILTLVSLNLLLLPLMTARWWLLLRTLGSPVALVALCAYRLAANAVSYLTPGPHFGGEPLSVYLLLHRHGIPLASGTTSVIIDRLLELVASFVVLTLCLIAPAFTAGSPFSGFFAPAIIVGMMTAVFSVLVLLFTGRQPLSRSVSLCRKLWGRYFPLPTGNSSSFVTTITRGEALAEDLYRRHRRQFLLANLFSLFFWFGVFTEFWLMSSFLGFALSFWQLTAVVAVARLAFFTPLPAGIGVLEAALPWLTGSLGLGVALGVSLCLIIRARDLLFSLAGLGLTMKYLTCHGKAGIINEQSRKYGPSDLL